MCMYLTVDKGTMFGGKSSSIVRRYLQYTKLYNPHRNNGEIRILAIKHQLDTRYSDDHIVTHDGKKIPCERRSTLLDLDVENWDVIFIDEGQWFTDLLQFVQKNFYQDIRVHVAGLNGDKNQNSFGDINLLSSYCSEENIHYGMCAICGDKAPFTIYKGKSKERDNLGTDEYVTVCHKHLYEKFECYHQ